MQHLEYARQLARRKQAHEIVTIEAACFEWVRGLTYKNPNTQEEIVLSRIHNDYTIATVLEGSI